MSDRDTATATATFLNRPRKADLPNQWKIMRAKSNGLPACMVISPDITGAYVHYWGGRTRPCQGESCDYCAGGQVPRWRGYLAAANGKTRCLGLLEVTPSCIPPIEAFIEEYGDLRGSIITLSRKGNVRNGELLCVVKHQAGLASSCPPDVDVRVHLQRIWRVTHSPMASEVTGDAYDACRESGMVGTKRVTAAAASESP